LSPTRSGWLCSREREKNDGDALVIYCEACDVRGCVAQCGKRLEYGFASSRLGGWGQLWRCWEIQWARLVTRNACCYLCIVVAIWVDLCNVERYGPPYLSSLLMRQSQMGGCERLTMVWVGGWVRVAGGWVDAVGLLPLYPYATSDPATSYHRRRGQDTCTRSASIFRLGFLQQNRTQKCGHSTMHLE
jgi:hypothetical protein